MYDFLGAVIGSILIAALLSPVALIIYMFKKM